MSIASATGTYTVCSVQADPLSLLRASDDHVFVIDARVWRLHRTAALARVPKARILVSATEELKTLIGVADLLKQLLAKTVTRRTRIVVIGGGTLQDAAGFAASIVHRGLAWTYVPTTLLAQADSCIGGKTSINHISAKNVLGSFHPPANIIVWPDFVRTLRDDDVLSGIGEISKLHLLGGRMARDSWAGARIRAIRRDPSTVASLAWASLRIKKRFIEADEFDRGVRQYLNYGHCFGHAIESATSFAVPHGQAVTLGMELANELAVQRRMMSTATRQLIVRKYLRDTRGASFRVDQKTVTKIVEAMGKDKKRTGTGLAVIVLDDRFRPVKLTDVTPVEAAEALAGWSRRRLSN